MVRIAFNLAFIDNGPLTGPGYYAVQLFENLLKLERTSSAFDIVAYVQKEAMIHFSTGAKQHIVPLPDLAGRLVRVSYEHVILPFRTVFSGTDILFSPAFVSPMWGGRMLVATICDMYYRVIPEMTEPFQRKYWNIMIPISAYLCDRIITISGNSKKDIETYIPAARGKTVSIPLASRFPVSDVAERSKSPRPVVLMVANLTPNKNCLVVVQAIALLRKKGVDVSFLHAGKDHVGLLRKSVTDYDAGGFVSSLGKVSDEDLVELYKSCLAVIVPSLYEGFGMPAVEAQAMGAPLICSNRAALPEAAGDGALYFDPEDPVALADKIERVLALSQAGRQKMIEAGYESARRLSWEKTARDTMAVFEELLAVK
jgi:glycosyltransferase involved in cell wall biosynthesis